MTSPDPSSFFYRNSDLDSARIGGLVGSALAGCDDGELYLQYGVSESFGFDDGRLKNASFDTQQGFGLRGLNGETTGFAHANELSESAIRRAAETVKLVAQGHGGEIALAPPRTNARLYTDENPLELVPFARKVALCQQIDAAARARDPRVAQVSVGLSGSWQVIEIVRPDGFVARDIRPLVRLNVSIVAEQNGRRESGFHGLGGRWLRSEEHTSEEHTSELQSLMRNSYA